MGSPIIEMHCHTVHSDGVISVSELLDRASAANLTHIAITDHDTTSGCLEAATIMPRGIRLIPGVEISSRYFGRDLHMLGYFIDPLNRNLLDKLNKALEGRSRRTQKMVGLLQKAGFDISVEWFEQTGTVLNRSNIARRLVEIGAVSSFGDAFDEYLDRGRPFYVEKTDMPSHEAVEAIHAAGGIAVIAHPAHYNVEDAIEPLVKSYGLDGVECFHSEQSQDDAMRLMATAKDLGLLITGGSDYHGDDVHPGSLSLCSPSLEDVEAFLELGRERGFDV